jgi:hypothetical protein
MFFSLFFSDHKNADHLLELIKIDQSIPIQINFFDNLCPHCLVLTEICAQNLSNLVGRNGAAAILVKQLKGSPQIRLIKQSSLVYCCCTPLTEVYRPISIQINIIKEFCCLFNHFDWVHCRVHFFV